MEEQQTDDTSDLLVAIAAVYMILVTMVGCLYCSKRVGGKEAILFTLGPLLAPVLAAGALALLACAIVLLIPAVIVNCLLGLCIAHYARPAFPYPNVMTSQRFHQQQPAPDQSNDHGADSIPAVQDYLIVRELLSLHSIPPVSLVDDSAWQVPEFPRHCQGPITILGSSMFLCFSQPIVDVMTTTTQSQSVQDPTDKAVTTPASEHSTPRTQDNSGLDSTSVSEEDGGDVERGIASPSHTTPSMNQSSTGTPDHEEQVEHPIRSSRATVNSVSSSHNDTNLMPGESEGNLEEPDDRDVEAEDATANRQGITESQLGNETGILCTLLEWTGDGPMPSLETRRKILSSFTAQLQGSLDVDSNTPPEAQEGHPGPPTNEPMNADAAKSPDTSCSICLEDFQKGDFIAWSKQNLDCPHMYHYHCLKNWLERRNHCPICRRKYM